jgi:hypothetical protein
MQDKQDKPDKHEITLTVGTPKGSFTAAFPKTAKVQDVIDTAIQKMQLQGGADAFEVFHGEERLAPTTRTLESFHLKDGDKLLIAATGSGV